MDDHLHHDEVFFKKNKIKEKEYFLKCQTYNMEIKSRVCWESVKGKSGCHPFLIWDINDIIGSHDNGREPWLTSS